MRKGFTLLELMIVLGIFSIMTVLMVANQRKFGDNIALSSLSYDVALSIREAQTYGFGAKGSGSGSSDFSRSYGVHFDTTDRSVYVMYADVNPDGIYTSEDELVRTYKLGQGVTVGDLYANPRDGTTAIPGNRLDITFTRPNPDAKILINDEDSGGSPFIRARICLVSVNGRKKQIQVLNSGQIATVDNNCVTN